MQPSSPPSNMGWDPLSLVATGVSYLSSINIWGSSSPENSIAIPGLEKAVDPFAFIVCIALRGFLGSGYKPTLEHYHITWDPPEEVKVAKAVKIPKQGWDRSHKGENASREIIEGWEDFTEKALDWFEPLVFAVEGQETLCLSGLVKENCPHLSTLLLAVQRNNPANENAQEAKEAPALTEQTIRELLLEVDRKQKAHIEGKKRNQIAEIFKLAIRGFEETKEPYLSEQEQPRTRQLIQKLDRCKKKVEDAIVRSTLNRADLSIGGAASLVGELKDIWDTETIGRIYNHFQELQKLLTKMKTPLEQKFFYDNIDAIEAMVTCKCTQFAMIQQRIRVY